MIFGYANPSLYIKSTLNHVVTLNFRDKITVLNIHAENNKKRNSTSIDGAIAPSYPADLFLPLSFIANSKTQPNVKLVRMWQHSYIFNLSQLSIPAWNCRPVYVMTERFHNRFKSHNNFEHSDSVARASDTDITILFKVYIDRM